MTVLLDVEQVENRWLVHAQGFWGCYAWVENPADAPQIFPITFEKYTGWLARYDICLPGDEPILIQSDEFQVNEIIRQWYFPPDPGYEVNAFFAHDAQLLNESDVQSLELLTHAVFEDLNQAVVGLTAEQCSVVVEDDWSIERILRHTASAGWWYLSLLGLDPQEPYPDNNTERLELVCQQLLRVIPAQVGGTQVSFDQGELWSVRKMLRRSFWHLRDHTRHTRHIWQFREKMGV